LIFGASYSKSSWIEPKEGGRLGNDGGDAGTESQLREAEAEQLKCERRNAALPHEFTDLRKQAGLDEDALNTPYMSYFLQRSHQREVIFGVPDIEIRRRLIAFIRRSDKASLHEQWTNRKVRYIRRGITDHSQFPVYSVLIEIACFTYIGWGVGNYLNLAVPGTVIGGAFSVVLVIDRMRRFERGRLRQVAEADENIKIYNDLIAELEGRPETFSRDEEETGVPDKKEIPSVEIEP
jgi:hypothetical protein